MNKEKYILAKQNCLIERYRGDEISRRIARVYPLSAQIALIMDKDEKREEWAQYQSFRSMVKQDVDSEISEIESSISAELVCGGKVSQESESEEESDEVQSSE